MLLRDTLPRECWELGPYFNRTQGLGGSSKAYRGSGPNLAKVASKSCTTFCWYRKHLFGKNTLRDYPTWVAHLGWLKGTMKQTQAKKASEKGKPSFPLVKPNGKNKHISSSDRFPLKPARENGP